MGITRDDVARKAGVSTAVVSYVINNGPRPVASETRERVLEAIRELGYRANFSARSLRGQRSRMLGIIVPDASNAFYSEVVKGVEDIAYAHSYELILGNTNHDFERQNAYLGSLISRQVDAIIFVTLTVEKKDVALLERFDVPAVYIAPEGTIDLTSPERLAYISADFETGGYAVGRHLLERGHRHIAALTGKNPIPNLPNWRWHRIEGFLRAAHEAGLEPPIIFAGEHLEDGYRVGLELLRSDDRPTAIFAGNDLLAIGAMRAAQDLGLRVPDDVAICGFDDIQMAQFVSPRLTTVRLEKYEIGKQAALMTLRFLDSPETPYDAVTGERNIHFATELVIREST